MARRVTVKSLALSVCAVVLVSGCSQAQCARDMHHTLQNSLELLDAQWSERYSRDAGECARVSIEDAEVELCEFDSQKQRDAYLSDEDDSNFTEPLAPVMSLVTADKHGRDSVLETLTSDRSLCSG